MSRTIYKGMTESEFVVKVMYHQHHTIQGEVLWTQAGQKEYFRSEMELIHLMNSAMGEDAAEKARIGRRKSYRQRCKSLREGEEPDE